MADGVAILRWLPVKTTARQSVLLPTWRVGTLVSWAEETWFGSVRKTVVVGLDMLANIPGRHVLAWRLPVGWRAILRGVRLLATGIV